jgi:hypothetical protein
MLNFYDFWKNNCLNDSLLYHSNTKILRFYIKGVCKFRKVFKDKNEKYYIKYNNIKYKLPVNIFNQRLTDSRSEIINF